MPGSPNELPPNPTDFQITAWLKSAKDHAHLWLAHIKDYSGPKLDNKDEYLSLKRVLRLMPPTGNTPKLKTAKDNVTRAILLLKRLLEESSSPSGAIKLDVPTFWNGPLGATGAAIHENEMLSLYPETAVSTADAYRTSDKLLEQTSRSDPCLNDPYLNELKEQIHAVEAISKKRALDLHELQARYLKSQHLLIEAAKSFGCAAELRAEIKDYSLSTRMMLHQASALYRAHEFHSAIEVLERARKVCLDQRLDTYDLRTYLRILELLGIAYGRILNFDKGLEYIDSAERLSNQANFHIPWFDATRKSKRGILLMDLQRLDEAIICMREAAQIRRREDLKAELARGLNWIALYYLKKGKISEALALFCVCLPQVHKQNPVEEMNVKFHRLHALKAWLNERAEKDLRIPNLLKMTDVIEQMKDSEEKTSALYLMKDHKPDPREIRLEEVQSIIEKDSKDVIETEQKLGFKRTFTEQLSKWR